MSERIWTNAQLRAIGHRGSDLLVSASAGSGKTATLTARLISLLCSPDGDVDPSEVLAVTYTKMAAGEMRDRLLKAAVDEVTRAPHNARARKLVTSIDRVQISTIHSFCENAIKPYFASLGLAPDFRIADEAEAAILRERAMNDVVSAMFEGGANDGDFVLLADCLASSRDETALDGALLALCSSLANKGVNAATLEKYAEALEKYAERDLFDTPLGDVIKRELRAFGEHYEKLFEYYLPRLCGEKIEERYVPDCELMIRFAKAAQRAAEGTFAEARDTMEAAILPTFPTVHKEDQNDESIEFGTYRKLFKKELDALKAKYFCFTDTEICASLRRTAKLERALSRAAGAYEDRYTELKRERNAVDFGDLERLAHRLLVGEDGEPTAAARELSARFRYVFIDEYQDTNRVQDDIFRAISKNAERFMVGDVKQSIYSFRGADPTVFAGVRRSFVDGEGGEYVSMSENFRSASNVISFTNEVSRRMFPFSATPFDESDELIFARTGPDCPEKCELVLLSGDVEDESGESESADGMSEQRYVALRTKELLETWRKPDGSPIKPGDIAVIIHSANIHGKSFADELTKLGIPVNLQAKRDLFADGTMLTLICLLNAVCSPELDVYFTGALKSAAFGFSLADTVKLRLDHPSVPICVALDECAENGEEGENGESGELSEKCRRVRETLRSLRSYAALLSPDAFIRHMAKTLDLETSLSTGGVSRAAVRRAVRSLRSIAAKASSGGALTLVQFMGYLARMMERGESVESENVSEDAVNIISIHHSKGLEFPVCFVTSAAKSFNMKDSSAGTMFEPTFGVAAKLPDPSGLVKCDTILRRVSAHLVQAAKIDEEMRSLYVAMTRARERLIIVAAVKNADDVLRSAKATAHLRSEYTVRNANGYLRWLLAPFADEAQCGAVTVMPELPASADSLSPAAGSPQSETGELPSASGESVAPCGNERVEELAKTFAERFEFEYPFEYLAKIPAKLTVSRLYPQILDEEPETAAVREIVLGDQAPVPRFMAGANDDGDSVAHAAEIGTATHVFMQFCDFERIAPKNGESVEALVSAELDRLRAERFIDERSASLVDLSQIAAFVRSPLFDRIRSARRVWREFRFNAARPAAKFTADEALAAKLAASGEDVIVQGVVDLLFEDADGRFVLVDYKTDRLTDYERAHPEAGKAVLRERHRTQLSYYRDILGDMTPRPIDETYVYSLTLADVAAID